VSGCGRILFVSTFVSASDVSPVGELERGVDRLTSIGVLIGVMAAVVAGATIWLLLTDPVTVVNAVDDGEVSPLVIKLAEVIYSAIAGLLAYL
jgi:hypothetical protein